MKSKTNTLGPEASRDLFASEGLNRPLVANYRNHYGNRTNEIELLVAAGKGLDRQRTLADGQLQRLSRGHTSLMKDLKDKKMASSIDSEMLRIRRRKVACI